MCDDNDHGGFPQGTDGISSLEEWGAVKATGDQGRVADAIYPQQPIIALVYVCAPVAQAIDFVISGISYADSTTTAAINTAIDEVFFTEGQPGGKNPVVVAVAGHRRSTWKRGVYYGIPVGQY